MDDILEVIGLINWRSHPSGMISWWTVWRKESLLHHFLISKVTSVGNQLFIFQTNVLSLFFRSVSKAPANEKMERPLSTMSEASNYTGASDNTTNAESPAGRVSDAQHLKKATAAGTLGSNILCLQPSRSSKKIHNFGKRSNSIRRNPSAPVIKRNWLYKQVSEVKLTQ